MVKVSTKAWFENCGGWLPQHDLAALHAGITAGMLDEQNEYGMTALHLAAASGWVEGVEELLRAGANTEARFYRTGETALLSALQAKHDTVVKALVAAGANPDAGNHFGLTPRGWAALQSGNDNCFAHIPEKPVQMPEPRIQNAEHLADHYHPRFKIPEREECESLKPGQAVDLFVFGPRSETKDDRVKVRITARQGRRPKVRYTATVETPTERTHLPPGTTEVEFGPENVATVYVPRKKR
jgi:hypothetical protein